MRRTRLVLVFLIETVLVFCAVSRITAQEPGSNEWVRRGWSLSSKDSPLLPNQMLVSPNEQYCLAMQWDGNLVLYEGKAPAYAKSTVWQTQTNRLPLAKYILQMQVDGNLVIYTVTSYENDTKPKAIWDSKTPLAHGDFFLALQNDGNLVIYRGTSEANGNRGVIWSSRYGIDPSLRPPPPCQEDTGFRGWFPGVNDSKCKGSGGGGNSRTGTTTTTWVNRSGKTLYIYFAVAGQTGIHCDNLTYAGTLVDGGTWSHSVRYGEWGWFKFQEDQNTRGCGVQNNKFESQVGGSVGGDKSQTININ